MRVNQIRKMRIICAKPVKRVLEQLLQEEVELTAQDRRETAERDQKPVLPGRPGRAELPSVRSARCVFAC